VSQLALKLIPQHERAPREYSSKNTRLQCAMEPRPNPRVPTQSSFGYFESSCVRLGALTVEPNAHTGLTHEECRSSRTRKPVSVVYLICVLSGQGSAVAGGGRARRGILLLHYRKPLSKVVGMAPATVKPSRCWWGGLA
jgi:hypothetical protein